jgi:hypothetical protein
VSTCALFPSGTDDSRSVRDAWEGGAAEITFHPGTYYFGDGTILIGGGDLSLLLYDGESPGAHVMHWSPG